ncbi:MAG: class I SAM-dependent methyltransferase [Actinomycetota bacterium]|nr:class I SAM-dependent methyltransferase [Actinomycetota bacterium]
MECRICGADQVRPFLDLGKTPLSDGLVRPEKLDGPEPRFPLEVAFCENCKIVHILEDVPEDVLFPEDYPYFSSFSDHLLRHSRTHVQGLIESRGLTSESLAVELASNDGYLLQNFVEAGVPVLGIDPAPEQVKTANEKGVNSICRFFGKELADELVAEGKRADVIVANNVFAHVPDLNGFAAGMKTLLAPGGLITIENPYVRDLIDHCEFDTIYHEHLFYHSCTGIDWITKRHGLHLNHVEYFPELHGGTLRYHVSHDEGRSPELEEYLANEQRIGLDTFAYYEGFARRVEQLKEDLLALLKGLRAEGKTIAAYGAAAKGSTMLNYVGINTDLVDFVVDRNVHKHGLHMPGTHQPIRPVEALLEDRPDYCLILAWNFKDEIVSQQAAYTAAGGTFIVPVPTPEVLQ